MENKIGKIIAASRKIEEIMNDVERGEFSIPKFQRNFVWPSKKVISLLDSIEKNYPFGVMMFWKDSSESISTRNEIFTSLGE